MCVHTIIIVIIITSKFHKQMIVRLLSHDPAINSVINLTILKIEKFIDKMLTLGFATL